MLYLEYTSISMAEQEEALGAVKKEDPVLVEINKKIESAFDIFDHEGNKTVDVRLERMLL